jgi:hypothetical protein
MPCVRRLTAVQGALAAGTGSWHVHKQCLALVGHRGVEPTSVDDGIGSHESMTLNMERWLNPMDPTDASLRGGIQG